MDQLDFSLRGMASTSIFHANDRGDQQHYHSTRSASALRLFVSPRLRALIIGVMVSIFVSLSSFAAEAPKITLSVGPQVIRCAAGPVGDHARLKKMLEQGASITVRWVFSITRVRPYWLNEDAGEVEVTRVVSSDLISRQWQLKDETAGMTMETNNPDRAVRFLSYLESFPLIDRALLVNGEEYQVRIKLHIRESDQPQAWWQRWVDFGKTVLTQRFSLPSAGK